MAAEDRDRMNQTNCAISISDGSESEATDTEEPESKRRKLDEMETPGDKLDGLEVEVGTASTSGTSSSNGPNDVPFPNPEVAITPVVSCSSSVMDEEDVTLERQRNATPAVAQAPAPTHEEYFTDPMDPNEIPSDLEYSPPRPARPIRNPTARLSIRLAVPITAANFLSTLTAQQRDHVQTYFNQLEVASASDIDENPIEDADSTSGTENDVAAGRLDEPEPLRATPANSDHNFADADSEALQSDDEKINSDKTRSSSIPSMGLNAPQSEISGSGSDKWTCNVCQTKTMPYFRFCSRCFKLRRNWLPSRPPSRRLKRRKTEEFIKRSNNVMNFPQARVTVTATTDGISGSLPIPVGITQEESHQSGSVVPGSSSQIRTCLPAAPPINLNEAFLVDDQNPALNRLNSDTPPGNATLIQLFTPPQSQTSIPEEGTSGTQSSQSQALSSSSQSQPSTSQASQEQSRSSEFLPTSLPKTSKSSAKLAEQPLCDICCVRPRDSAFVHNKVAHQYCCFTCADKILKRDGKCPICRGRILRVVKLIEA